MKRIGLSILSLALVLIGLLANSPVQAALSFNDPGFANLWNRVDKPVQDGSGVGRGYTWGPPVVNTAATTTELYNGLPRKVQYFDKARMEVNNSNTNPNDPYYVTTGLLVREMVTGQRQDGDKLFVGLTPSPTQVAGDANDNGANAVAPTYASFRDVVTFNGDENTRPNTPGQVINARLDHSGQVSIFNPPQPRLLEGYDSVTRHNIADVFVRFGNQRGSIWNGSSFVQDAVFSGNPTYVLGRPVSEPYWMRAVVGGIEKDVLVQLFERRVLTYTPGNPAGFEVEMGNVGQHYYRWRYALNNCPIPPPPNPPDITTPPVQIGFKGRGTIQDQTFFSATLGRQMPYRVYLPPGYNTSAQHYPVLYMLHGFGGDYREWDNYGLLGVADDLIGGGTIQPLIIVLPSGEQSYWLNQANCGTRWGDYTAQEVVGQIDKTYRTIPNPTKRAVGGLSMGGHGALQLGFNYPNSFSIVGAHSPTLRDKDHKLDFFGDDYYFATIDPLSLARTKDLQSYQIWLDIGQDDTEWRPRTEELHQVLLDRGKAHSWHLWPGGHGGAYWASHCIDYLQFYNAAFSRR